MAKVKRHKKISKVISKKSLAFLIILALNALSLGQVGGTAANFTDMEVSSGNLHQAGEINFTLSQNPFSPPESVINFSTSTVASSTVKVIPEVSSNPFWYHASSTNFGNDLDFCKTLSVKSRLEGVENYSGLLSNFISPATTTLDDWQFDLSTNINSYNKICSFDFEYSAWQSRHNLPQFDEMGFSDVEKVKNTIASQGFRINKVYYDVKSTNASSTNRGVEGDNEWVEIYNQTDSALDITGWQICDNTSCDTLASTSPIIIMPHGFAVITAKSSTWNYWVLKNNVVPIVLGQDIGNGLSNDEDMLTLKRPDGVIIDQMNWGIPNNAWANYNSDLWNPGVPDVPEGHSLARSPNGHDTNTPSDWVDLAPPLLNLTSPNQSGNLTWYWGDSHAITWTATNPNGPNSDLKIDLAYIKDMDNSKTITPLDQTISIATGLANTGIYNWIVPSGFIGYIWVKISAFGPENPMMNSSMTSGKIYDPFPIEILLTDPGSVIESIIDAINDDDSPDFGAATTTTEIMPVIPTTEEATTTTTEIIPESVGGGSSTTPEVITEPEILPEVLEEETEEPVEIVETEPAVVEEPIEEAVVEAVSTTEPIPSEPAAAPEPEVAPSE